MMEIKEIALKATELGCLEKVLRGGDVIYLIE